MDFLMVLFVFILPAAAVAMSGYCMYHILAIKRIGDKLAALHRLSGKDAAHE